MIPDAESDFTLFVVTCLAQSDAQNIYLLSSKAKSPVRTSRFCTSSYIRSKDADEAWFDHIRRITRQVHVDVILPISEDGIRFASAWRGPLSKLAALPPLPRADFFDVVADKGLFANHAFRHRLPHPRTISDASERTLEDQLCEISLPALVKPRRASNGVGIQYYDDEERLRDFVRTHQEVPGGYVVQEFVYGRDIDCSVLCKDGQILAYTMQQPTIDNPRRFAPPRGIKFVHDAQTLATVKELVSTLSWSGIGHIDMRFNERDRRIEIIEINPRYWASLLGSLIAGVNFPYLSCLTGLKENFPDPQYGLGEFMAVKEAAKQTLRKLTGRGVMLPNIMNQTMLPYIFRDPLPHLIRLVRR